MVFDGEDTDALARQIFAKLLQMIFDDDMLAVRIVPGSTVFQPLCLIMIENGKQKPEKGFRGVGSAVGIHG